MEVPPRLPGLPHPSPGIPKKDGEVLAHPSTREPRPSTSSSSSSVPSASSVVAAGSRSETRKSRLDLLRSKEAKLKALERELEEVQELVRQRQKLKGQLHRVSSSSSTHPTDTEGDEEANPTSAGSSSEATSEGLWEQVRVKEELYHLPLQLSQVRDLSNVLNMDTWNNVLDENDRARLATFLPPGTPAETNALLGKLFAGESFAFGNPLTSFHRDYRLGLYEPKVAKWRKKLYELERAKHAWDLQQHHCGMLQRALQFKYCAGLLTQDSDEFVLVDNPPVSTGSDTETSDGEHEDEEDEATASEPEKEVVQQEPERKKRPVEEPPPPQPAAKKPSKKKRRVENGTSNEPTEPQPSKKKKDQLTLSVAPSIVFRLFIKLKEVFNLMDGVTFEDLVDKLKSMGPTIRDELLPPHKLREFIKLALIFLASPPALTPAGTSAQPTAAGSDPIVKFDKMRKVWRWIDQQVTDTRLQSLEQLFYFAVSRRYVNEETGAINIAATKFQKCGTTMEPSSEEVLADHHRQEIERYKTPEKAFSYLHHGVHTVVAPMKRTAGTASNKPREHFLLKTQRPPHVNILCLVRDAASRLPGGIGTRPDVALLLRDSQWVAEATEEKVNQVVSGALDRLHSQKDLVCATTLTKSFGSTSTAGGKSLSLKSKSKPKDDSATARQSTPKQNPVPASPRSLSPDRYDPPPQQVPSLNNHFHSSPMTRSPRSPSPPHNRLSQQSELPSFAQSFPQFSYHQPHYPPPPSFPPPSPPFDSSSNPPRPGHDFMRVQQKLQQLHEQHRETSEQLQQLQRNSMQAVPPSSQPPSSPSSGPSPSSAPTSSSNSNFMPSSPFHLPPPASALVGEWRARAG